MSCRLRRLVSLRVPIRRIEYAADCALREFQAEDTLALLGLPVRLFSLNSYSPGRAKVFSTVQQFER